MLSLCFPYAFLMLYGCSFITTKTQALVLLFEGKILSKTQCQSCYQKKTESSECLNVLKKERRAGEND